MLNYYSDAAEEKKIIQLAERKLKGISKLFNNRHMLIAEGERKEIFLLSDELFKVYKELEGKKHPFSVGMFFGEYVKDDLKLSLQAVTEYVRFSEHNRVLIHRDAEQKFLYGRNLHNKVIVSYDQNLKKGDTAIICTQKNEPLGIGIVTGDFASKLRVQVIKNMMDIGWYIRHKE